MDAGLINSIILSLITAVMFFYALYGVVRAAVRDGISRPKNGSLEQVRADWMLAARYKASGWDFLTAFRDGECRV